MPEVEGVRGDLLLPHRLVPSTSHCMWTNPCSFNLNIQGRYKFVYVTAEYEKLQADISRLSKEDIDAFILRKKDDVSKMISVRRSASLVAFLTLV